MVMPSGEQTRVPVCSGRPGEAGGANVLEALEAQKPDRRTAPLSRSWPSPQENRGTESGLSLGPWRDRPGPISTRMELWVLGSAGGGMSGKGKES